MYFHYIITVFNPSILVRYIYECGCKTNGLAQHDILEQFCGNWAINIIMYFNYFLRAV